MQRILLEQFIVISGSGKKVGKTFLATALIRAFHPVVPLVALKISPHVHDSVGNSRLMVDGGDFRIYRDLEPHKKNSGQYLYAGATASYFMEAEDRFLDKAFRAFLAICNPENRPVVCESGALGSLFSPAVFIFITSGTEGIYGTKARYEVLADLILPARIFSSEEVIKRVHWTGLGWELKENRGFAPE